MTAIFYVYVMFRPDASPCYIGKGKRKRIDNRIARSRHIRNIIKKHGDLPKLKIRDGLTEMEAFAVEIALIAAIGRAPNGPLVNMTDGGEGTSGREMSAAARAAISAAQRGRKATDEARARLRASHLGKKASPEAIAKMKASCQPAGARSPHPPESYAKQAAKLRGRKLSAEHRARIGAAGRGRKASPETIAKKRAAALGKPCSLETRAKLRAINLGKKRARPASTSESEDKSGARRELDI